MALEMMISLMGILVAFQLTFHFTNIKQELTLFHLKVIGRLHLGGPKCEGSALHHWKEIQSSPRRQIAEWHKLKE